MGPSPIVSAERLNPRASHSKTGPTLRPSSDDFDGISSKKHSRGRSKELVGKS
jgi:hypothetical protein